MKERICLNCNKRFQVNPKNPRQKFCSRKCVNNREYSARWKGGRYTETQGYIRVKAKNHPFCDKQGYVLEHRLVVEDYLGRHLKSEEEIHHKNGSKQDNRIENLEIYSASEHRTKHNLENNPFKGKKHTSEYKKKRSEFFKKYWQIHNKMVEKFCNYCGKSFRRPQSRFINSKHYFCSYECFRRFRRQRRVEYSILQI